MAKKMNNGMSGGAFLALGIAVLYTEGKNFEWEQSLSREDIYDEQTKPEGTGATQPHFTPDPRAPYAHPYYWAPFILIGNWK
ncbi:MAG TPA: hypothetical protein VGX03_13255 [Candidatus Binatia bacterium]|jgi:CHAT domain-containing protein|nr:hypothetical protein [Candidatus Binatia bacterium]